MKKSIYLFVSSILMVTIFLLSGCSSETVSPKKVSDGEVKTEEKAVTNEIFKVGDAIQLGKSILTVTQVEKSSGSEWDTPKTGNEYVIVHVKLENKGKDNIAYNPYDFKIKNSKGQLTDTGFVTIDQDTELASGELASGGVVEGTVPFEAPVGDTALQLIYQPNFWVDKETITINLQ